MLGCTHPDTVSSEKGKSFDSKNNLSNTDEYGVTFANNSSSEMVIFWTDMLVVNFVTKNAPPIVTLSNN